MLGGSPRVPTRGQGSRGSEPGSPDPSPRCSRKPAADSGRRLPTTSGEASSDDGRNQKGPQEAGPEQASGDWGPPSAAQRRSPGGLLRDGGLCRPAAREPWGCSGSSFKAQQSEHRLERLKQCLKRSAFRKNGALGHPPARPPSEAGATGARRPGTVLRDSRLPRECFSGSLKRSQS